MHIDNNNPEFLEKLLKKGVNAEVLRQLANPPDTHLLDLGFFCAVQSANDEAMAEERVR